MNADAEQRAARRTRERWEAMYQEGETPWDDGQPWRPLPGLLSRYAPPGGRLLDIGCGLGGKAAQMASMGYRVLGVDISQAAIDAARVLTAGSEGDLELRRADFLNESPDAPFDLAFDRSVWATFDESGRARFARRVAHWLVPGGHWISLTGCADNRDPRNRRTRPARLPPPLAASHRRLLRTLLRNPRSPPRTLRRNPGHRLHGLGDCHARPPLTRSRCACRFCAK